MMNNLSNVNNLIYFLSKQGEKVIESETFRALNYVLKDGQITLMSDRHGIFTFNIECLDELVEEIKDILFVWKDVRTKKCRIGGEK